MTSLLLGRFGVLLPAVLTMLGGDHSLKNRPLFSGGLKGLGGKKHILLRVAKGSEEDVRSQPIIYYF